MRCRTRSACGVRPGHRRVPGVQPAAGQRPEHPAAAVGLRRAAPRRPWCLCAARWAEALAAGVAPPVVLEATHAHALEWVDLDDLRKHGLTPGTLGAAQPAGRGSRPRGPGRRSRKPGATASTAAGTRKPSAWLITYSGVITTGEPAPPRKRIAWTTETAPAGLVGEPGRARVFTETSTNCPAARTPRRAPSGRHHGKRRGQADHRDEHRPGGRAEQDAAARPDPVHHAADQPGGEQAGHAESGEQQATLRGGQPEVVVDPQCDQERQRAEAGPADRGDQPDPQHLRPPRRAQAWGSGVRSGPRVAGWSAPSGSPAPPTSRPPRPPRRTPIASPAPRPARRAAVPRSARPPASIRTSRAPGRGAPGGSRRRWWPAAGA